MQPRSLGTICLDLHLLLRPEFHSSYSLSPGMVSLTLACQMCYRPSLIWYPAVYLLPLNLSWLIYSQMVTSPQGSLIKPYNSPSSLCSVHLPLGLQIIKSIEYVHLLNVYSVGCASFKCVLWQFSLSHLRWQSTYILNAFYIMPKMSPNILYYA